MDRCRPKAAAALAADVAEALFHAHQQGIVHRDVKPANILVERRSGRARLIDFGIAHSLEAASNDLTRTGTSLGTPRYMAPEQLAGDPIGPRTDLWGLGAVLYQALSGRVPFDGATPLAIATQQQAGAPPLDVDPALAAVVIALPVDSRIDDRPIHAGAVAQALRAWIDGDPAPGAGHGIRRIRCRQHRSAETVAIPVSPGAAARHAGRPAADLAHGGGGRRAAPGGRRWPASGWRSVAVFPHWDSWRVGDADCDVLRRPRPRAGAPRCWPHIWRRAASRWIGQSCRG